MLSGSLLRRVGRKRVRRAKTDACKNYVDDWLTQVAIHYSVGGGEPIEQYEQGENRRNKTVIRCSLLVVKVLQGRCQIIHDDDPVRPNLALLLPLHIQQFPDALGFVNFLLPPRDLQCQRSVQPVEDDEEAAIVGIAVGHAPHLDDVRVPDDGQETALHGEIDHAPHEPLGILEALLAEGLDGVASVLPLAETSARHELAILDQDSTVIPELAELVLLLVDDGIVVRFVV